MFHTQYFTMNHMPILIQDHLIFLVQVAVGGVDGILRPTLDEKLTSLYEKVAALAAQPKSDESEHILENYYSSRTIRKLVLECPTFASILWQTALKGNSKLWAAGHRYTLFPTLNLL